MGKTTTEITVAFDLTEDSARDGVYEKLREFGLTCVWRDEGGESQRLPKSTVHGSVQNDDFGKHPKRIAQKLTRELNKLAGVEVKRICVTLSSGFYGEGPFDDDDSEKPTEKNALIKAAKKIAPGVGKVAAGLSRLAKKK